MRCAAALAAMVALLALGTGVAAAQTIPGEVVVRYRPAADGTERAAARAAAGARLEQRLVLPHAELLQVPRGAVGRAIERLEARSSVLWAEPNLEREPHAIPADPGFAQQWSLRNTGQTVLGTTGPAGIDIDAVNAWNITTGSPTVPVAVVDSGIAFGHEDLAFQLWSNPGETGAGRESNHVDDDGNGLVDDVRGWDFIRDDNEPYGITDHGTHVAGIIGAEGNNGTSISGVAWQTRLVPLRACVNTCSSAATASAFAYAGQKGVRLVNASLGSPTPSQAERDAIEANPNTLYVVSAGNGGADQVGDDVAVEPTYPCSYPSANVLCVAATRRTDALIGFSNFGSGVDVAAPGQDILSTVIPPDVLHSDDFEGAQHWNEGAAGAFARTTERSASPTQSITDSPGANYAANTDRTATLSDVLNFTGRKGCVMTYRYRLVLGAGDLFVAEYKLGPSGPWTQFNFGMPPTGGAFLPGLVDLEFLQDEPQVRFRFRLHSDGSGQDDGAHLDDVLIRCATVGDSVGYLSGTSMAAPVVTGIGALVRTAHPTISTAALKDAIVRSADLVPALYGKVAADGRVDGRSALRIPGDTTPPVAFPLTGPADGAVIGDPTPDLAWSATGDVGSGLQCYQLVVNRAGAGSVVERDRLLPGTITATPATPLPDGVHSWSVRAVDKAGNVRSSDTTRSLTVDTIAPAAFTTIRPAPGAATNDPRPFFEWEPSSDAGSGLQQYDVFVDGVSRATITGAGTGTYLPADLGAGPHQWWVRARDRAGHTSQTPFRSLLVDRTKPSDPVQLDPAPGAVTGAEPVFSWQPSTDAGGSGSGIARYFLVIDGQPIPGDLPPTATSASAPAALAEGEHRWSVIVHDKAGNVATSGTRTFTVELPAPPPPEQPPVAADAGAAPPRDTGEVVATAPLLTPVPQLVVLPDRRAPRIRVRVATRPLVRTLLRRGLTLTCRVDEPATCAVELRLASGRLVVATAKRRVLAGRAAALRLRLTARGRRALLGRRRGAVRLVVVARATDAAGNRGSARRAIRARR